VLRDDVVVVDRPTGTVTFLFTDIEGSTQLWEAHPVAMRVAVARHDQILRGCIESRGYVFSTAGDSFAAVFARAADAIDAAVDAQIAISQEEWPQGGSITVRMGLHTGEAEERDGDYFGPVLNRAARLMSVGHGGQILVSSTVAEIAEPSPRWQLRDLGAVALKGVDREMRVFQLVVNGTGGAVPLLRQPDFGGRGLPHPRSAFVGRKEERLAVASALDQGQLVTLVGLGGVGKTRLALEVAWAQDDVDRERTLFVDLSDVDDPRLVPRTVAAAVGVPLEAAGGDHLGALVAHLASRHVLILVDNCEHLVEAVADLVDVMLDRCRNAKLLATSREPLGVTGETIIPIGPLAIGNTQAGSEAESLFIDRVRAAAPEVELSPSDPAVQHICRSLDGLPLALELAAARVRHFGVDGVKDLLEDRFELLGQARRGSPRHQSLAGALDWSYDLLAPLEKAFFRRLGAYSGSFPLDAVEQVAGATGLPVNEALPSLVDKSLVVVEHRRDRRPTYRMLQTVDAYAALKLVEAGEEEHARDAHRAWMTNVLEGADEDVRLASFEFHSELEELLPNLRAALEWTARTGGDVTPLVRGATGLWSQRGHESEGLRWLDRCQPHGAIDITRSLVAMAQDDFRSMARYARQAVERGPNDSLWAAMGSCMEALAQWPTQPERLAEAGKAARQVLPAGNLIHETGAWFEAVGRVMIGETDEAKRLTAESMARLGANAPETLPGYHHTMMTAFFAYADGDWQRSVAATAPLVYDYDQGGHMYHSSAVAFHAAALARSGQINEARTLLLPVARGHIQQRLPLQISSALIAAAAIALADEDPQRSNTLLRQAAAGRTPAESLLAGLTSQYLEPDDDPLAEHVRKVLTRERIQNLNSHGLTALSNELDRWEDIPISPAAEPPDNRHQ
jgi:predicted ATPase/class 3 adenylate cyclase